MPLVIIKTGLIGPDGKEEILQEYMCDTPCGNIATHVVGIIRELGLAVVICEDCRVRTERVSTY
jgi:hypothetical protein